jgi:hypothetical protein
VFEALCRILGAYIATGKQFNDRHRRTEGASISGSDIVWLERFTEGLLPALLRDGGKHCPIGPWNQEIILH